MRLNEARRRHMTFALFKDDIGGGSDKGLDSPNFTKREKYCVRNCPLVLYLPIT